MPLIIYDTIKPDEDAYPAVEAADVGMPDGTRLSQWGLVSTELPADNIPIPNTMYFLGEISSLTVGFPETANNGAMVYISFSSGSSVVNLSITSENHTGLERLNMNTNKFYELIGLWNGSKWVFVTNEVANE